MNRPVATEDHNSLQALLTTIDLPSLLDHAWLDPLQGGSAMGEQLEAARFWGCRGFCIPSGWVRKVRPHLPTNGPTRLVAVVGFPTGAVPSAVKLAEAEWVAEAGADELDVVPDFAALADGNTEQVHGELAAIVQLGLPVKVITEAARLPGPLLEQLVEMAVDAGAQWLKTGAGHGPGVAPELVRQLVKLARGRAAVKAAGGIHGLEQALRLLEAGARRLGLSRAPALLEAARRHQTGNLR
ncbi:MAG: deoxyribose-phosphate aldolase [Synechococcus sp. SB0678_bin_12]|nr:deoxyribose-phosphate aldolase [Synechococcus sp. SB0667_bin_8]MYF35618.1 deoxyribose-phosphate aldolase [Synechococcus sp. SB0678_bin_12]MYI88186.1 deoxyribose-phosphate aldolase [Synechococcus sp. SB0672_bin_10]